MKTPTYREWLSLKRLQLSGFFWARSHAPARRVIFVHIPKCGGMSVQKFFRAHVGSQRSGRTSILYEGAMPNWNVEGCRHATFVAGHFGWDALEQIRRPGDFVFTFLRDPLERLQSTHAFASSHHHRRGSSFPDFADFITNSDPGTLVWSHNVIARQLAMSIDARSLTLSSDEAAERAIKNLATFDYVGFHQTFEDDFREVAGACGLPRRGIPHFNGTRRPTDARTIEKHSEALKHRLEADQIVYREALRMRRRYRMLPVPVPPADCNA